MDKKLEKAWGFTKVVLVIVLLGCICGAVVYGSWYLFLDIIEAIARTIKNA